MCFCLFVYFSLIFMSLFFFLLTMIYCLLFFFFFFFKQKTAYEMLRSLVGSEMCIRDRFSMCPTTFNLIKNNRLCYFPLKIDMRQFLAPEDNFAPLAARSLEEADTQFNLCPTLHQLKGVVPLSTSTTTTNKKKSTTGMTPSRRLEEFLSTPLCEPPVLPSTREQLHHDPRNLQKGSATTTSASTVTPDTASTLTDLQFLCPNLYHFLRKELPESCTGYSQSDASYNSTSKGNTIDDNKAEEGGVEQQSTCTKAATRGGSGRGLGGRGKRGRETSSNGTSSPCISASHTPFALSPPNATDTLTAVGTTTTTSVSYTHLRAHETPEHLVCRLLLEKKKKKKKKTVNHR
eukprot:TRINITY_DN7133_c0_g1_i1.p1 TRINITY_DN7133_c0_g1~~TRINITY_DN7133_c0_g1_i1.p1  ORF type:complete len:347 (+),score=94.32 TRINITY_DN7133_c0_g1_i1:20-1060(+)